MNTSKHSLLNPTTGRAVSALSLALAVCASPRAEAQSTATNKVADPKKAAEADPNAEPVNWITLGGGGVSISGDKARFQERYGKQQGGLGGLKDFHYEMMVGQKGMIELDGKAMYGDEDYSVKLKWVDPEVGFVRGGFRQFTTWYAGGGAYNPSTGLAISQGDNELSLRRGEFWIEGGLTPPDGPMLTLKLSREYRKGMKDSIEWTESNNVLGNVVAGTTRCVMPSFRELDEIRNRIQADLKHTVGKTDYGLALRLDMVDNDNKFKSSRYVTSVTPLQYVTQRDVFESDLFHVRGTTESRLNDQTMLTSGYSYTRITTDITGGSRIFGTGWDVPYSPAFPSASPYVSVSGGSIVNQYVMNLSLRLEPFQDFVIVPSVRVEHNDTSDSSFYTTGPVAPALPVNNSTASATGLLTVNEALEARYTGVTNWTFYARGEWSEQNGALQELTTSGPIYRKTESERFTQKYTLGANWYPLRRLSFSGQYYHKTAENNYANAWDSTSNANLPLPGGSGNRYPAFILQHSFETDDMNVRATWRPLPNVTAVTRYDYTISTIHMRADQLNNVENAKTVAHIASQSLSWAPWSRLFLTGSFNYSLDSTSSASQKVGDLLTEARNDYWMANAGLTFIVDDKTDLTANYSYYSADNYVDNSLYAMPYGTSENDQTFNVGIKRNFTKTVSGSLSYGYFMHNEPSSGGLYNYNAHLIFSSLTYRF
ncbi:MAG: hypothetical protein WCS99_10105 [Limisphaerales bacterium]